MTGAMTSAEARDLVHLRSGRILEGKVEKETEDEVVLRAGKATMYLPRADVVLIERDQELPDWEADLRRELEAERRKREEKRAKEREKAEQEKESVGASGPSSEADPRLRRLVEDLASDEADTRRQARALLEREGKRAIPAITEALFHSKLFARESAALLLGKMNARESVRDMIIALAGAVPDAKKVRFWQRPFVRALSTSVSRITGKSFRLGLQAANQDKVVAKYIEWWDGDPPKGDETPKGACVTWDTPQTGEAEIAEDDPEREKKLWEARRVGSRRASYPVPASLGGGEGGGT